MFFITLKFVLAMLFKVHVFVKFEKFLLNNCKISVYITFLCSVSVPKYSSNWRYLLTILLVMSNCDGISPVSSLLISAFSIKSVWNLYFNITHTTHSISLIGSWDKYESLFILYLFFWFIIWIWLLFVTLFVISWYQNCYCVKHFFNFIFHLTIP